MLDEATVRLGNQGFGVSGSFADCALAWTSRALPGPFLIANASMQKYPDQLTHAMHDCADGFLVSQARYEATVDDLEDAAFMLDGSIGRLIE